MSVITPFYREFDLIERAVRSVHQQHLPENVGVEVVIGNDSKQPEHRIRSVLSDASNRITKIVPNTRDNGAGNARNAALDAATGDVVAFLDADDYWLPGKLERQLHAIAGGANFVAGGYRFDGRSSVVTPPRRIGSTADLLRRLGVNTSTVMVRRDFLGEHRFKNLRFCQDAEFWARLAGKSGFCYAPVNDVVAIYEPSGRTSNKFRQLRAFSKVVNGFPLTVFERAEIYMRYAVRGVMNYYVRR